MTSLFSCSLQRRPQGTICLHRTVSSPAASSRTPTNFTSCLTLPGNLLSIYYPLDLLPASSNINIHLPIYSVSPLAVSKKKVKILIPAFSISASCFFCASQCLYTKQRHFLPLSFHSCWHSIITHLTFLYHIPACLQSLHCGMPLTVGTWDPPASMSLLLHEEFITKMLCCYFHDQKQVYKKRVLDLFYLTKSETFLTP